MLGRRESNSKKGEKEMSKRLLTAMLAVLLAITTFAQTTGTPVTFLQGPLSGTAANKGANVQMTLTWTPTAYPALLVVSDGRNLIEIRRASATAPWIMGQILP